MAISTRITQDAKKRLLKTMSKLISDYFCVATSGATIDGREIKPEWLTGAARAYNADFYAARIWFEHIRYYGAMGDVFAVKAVKGEDGLVRLYNRIIPSPQLVSLKQNGRALYSSIEVAPQLKATGKPYQVGLAVTDSPASFGTDRIEFAIKQLEQDSLFSASMEIPDLDFSKERSFFDMARSLFGKTEEAETEAPAPAEAAFSGVPPTPPPAAPDNKFSTPEPTQQTSSEDIDMTKDEIKQLFNEVLDEKLAALKAEQKTEFATQLEEAVKPLKEQLDTQQENLNSLKDESSKIYELSIPHTGSNPNETHHAGGDPEKPQFDC